MTTIEHTPEDHRRFSADMAQIARHGTTVDLASACARLAEITRAAHARSYSVRVMVWSHERDMSVEYTVSIHTPYAMLAHESGPVLSAIIDTVEVRLCPARCVVPDTITLPEIAGDARG